VYTPFFSGVHGSYLKASIRKAGLDPDNLPLPSSEEKLTYRSRDERPKTWKDIWGAGQGVGNIESVLPAAELIERIAAEYATAKQRLTA
jgi:nitronate monooxygenase